MARYALVASIGGSITTYPYTYQAFLEANPGVSFPRSPNAARLRDFNIVEVLASEKPAYDLTKDIVEGIPSWNGEGLNQTWAEVAASPERIAERQAEAQTETDKAAIKSNPAVQAFINMTPAQVSTYVANNSGTVAERVGLTEKLALMVLLLARRELK